MKNKIIDFNKVKADKTAETQFLNLLAADIEAGNVKKIPEIVFDRIAVIKHKALVARQNH